VIPLAVSVPVILVFPAASVPAVLMFPAVTCPVIPAPPVTVMAPVVVVVLAVPLVKLEIPDADSVVVVVAPAASVPVTVFPEVTCPATPKPPETTRAPLPVVVLAVALVNEVIPDVVSDPIIVVFPDEREPEVTNPPEVT